MIIQKISLNENTLKVPEDKLRFVIQIMQGVNGLASTGEGTSVYDNGRY